MTEFDLSATTLCSFSLDELNGARLAEKEGDCDEP